MTPSAKREVLAVLVHKHQVPVGAPARREAVAGGVLPASAFSAARDADVVAALNDVVARHSRWGFWKCVVLPRNQTT
jgi:hypothetical protein